MKRLVNFFHWRRGPTPARYLMPRLGFTCPRLGMAAGAGVIARILAGPDSRRQSAGVTYERILKAAAEPQNWLTYGGTYMSQRFSGLNQITPSNVANLESKWVVQNQVFGAWQSNPLVVDGMMYVTQRPNDVMAIDARTGKMFWLYRYTPSPDARVCCGANNRGVAILGDTLYLGTLDAHLIALDARSGKPLWNIEVGDVKLAYSITMMPLIVKDKVVVGVGGGEFGIRGYVVAYDAKTGKEAWKFYTIPGPGEPGHDSWPGDAWKTGAGSVWVTGSYDPDLNLTYWGIGNPGPGLESGSAARRQPVHRFRRRARRRHRQAEMAFPVHAERRLRLRLGAGAGARRHRVAGEAAQGDDVGEPQRLLLRARSRHRRVPARASRSSR